MNGDAVTLPAMIDASAAQVNWGRWVSRCPRCTNAWQVDLSVILWMCRECWTVSRPAWPADPVAIEWLLGQRPDPITRNWYPGETLAELFAENAAHGILPAGVDQLENGADVLTEIDGRVVSGEILSALTRYRELTGSPGAALEIERG